MTPEPRPQSVTRQQLEVVARRLAGDVEGVATGSSDAAKKTGPALAVLAALGAFLWGLRRGRRKQVYVQVKRKR